MRYLCLLHVHDDLVPVMSPEQFAAREAENEAFDRALFESGRGIAAMALADASRSKVLGVRRGEASLTDGPYIETKEQVGGFILLEAESMEEVVRILATDPMAEYVSWEIRPELGLDWQRRLAGLPPVPAA